ncbi:trifunctional serine/threonine-protein kinase/ATP-binding protein/sensor histidine kinase [Desulfopila aestuarii]|uniref:histidine kinase n=1 Tax=Desulfopila aestuarii DSM 18488 TaxID=1121416 RepID=A0A1M7XW33_9BACT|nr:ATP-binding protein [Desulfopila aestuarii]SHO42932.1 Predicted ATPase [Desulfopila aestuarii DSM 18488]
MQTIAGYHPRQRLFENHTTLLLRAQHSATGKTVLLKLLKGEHPKNERINRLRQEYSLLSSFDSPFIIQTYGLEKHLNSLVIVLEDCLDTYDMLSEVIQHNPFSLEQFLELGAAIAQTLATVHDSNIIYRNCNPTGILISKDRRRIKFYDFRLATEEDAPGPSSREVALPDAIVPYISPEQTGRIEHPVDYRSDLYSLGITLFQLATRTLPFTGESVGELYHAHLARKPPLPDDINRSLPKTVSAIILRLLEKIPERRYQTSHGLLYDLQHCQQQLQQRGSIADFPLGRHDAFQTLEIPAQLSNRDKELKFLAAKHDEAASGQLVAVSISGEEGVGKSSLVQTFINRQVREETYCISAKFDRTTTPHSPLDMVVRQLVGLILSEDSDSISRRKTQILQALGNEGSVLAAVFPETEQLLGQQGSVPQLTQAENDNRLFRVLGKFLRVCCETGPALIIFLDDLHFAKAEHLNPLHHILSSARIGRLLFLGAFRKKAATIPGPLQKFLEALNVTNPNVYELQLENLQLPDIAELLSTMLTRNRREVGELAALCLQKTGGNPYFLRQFLAAANKNGHIIFSHPAQRWEWDISGINSSQLTPNTAEAVKKKVPALSAATTELLRTAAALGNSCSLELVAAIIGHHPERELAQLFREGLMFTTDDITTPPSLHFAHVQIREEALLPLSLDERSAIRLRAGRHLLYTLSPEEYNHRLPEISEYLEGDDVRRVASRAERMEIAKVQLDAGRQKMGRENFHGAHQSFLTGLAALPEDSWETDYALTLRLHTLTCASGLQISDHIAIDRCFHEVCANITTTLDSCLVYRLRIKSLKAIGKPEQAVATTLTILKQLGTTLPETPSQTKCLWSLLTTWIRLHPYNDKKLTGLPEMTDPTALATMGLLREGAIAAYACTPRLLPFLAGHAIRLTLQYGQCQESYLIGYLTYGFLLCGLSTRTIEEGYRFGQLAMKFENTRNNSTVKINQAMFAYYNFISHWKEHIRKTLPPLRQTMLDLFEQSNLESTAHTAFFICARHYLIGTNLSRLGSRIDEHLELVQTLDQRIAARRLKIIGEAVAALQGKTADQATLSGSFFDEKEELQRCLTTGDKTSYAIAMVLKLVHAVLFQDHAHAIRFSDQARPYLKHLTASALLPLFYFYDSLARLASYNEQGPMDRLRTRLTVTRQQRTMKRWARLAPQNYAHKYLLVEAECKRVLSEGEKAMELYDNAIHLAHEHQYTNEEALAYELASRFYSERKKTHIARLYLREARYCYYRWGTSAKINQLDSNSNDDNSTILPRPESPASFSPGEGASRLDMLTVIKASRVLSSEMVLDELLMKMMRIMLESGGAQKGALIFMEGGEWLIKVWGNTSRKAIITLTRIPVNTQNIAPTSIINYVAHAAKEVVLDDACRDGGFTNDVYVLENRPRSVLCMPIIHQGEIFSILYLENNLASGTFPPDRQELLQLLGVQSAISLKNALLFEELEQTVTRLNQEIEKRQNTQQQLLHAEKLSALGRLSASIAHEFGNPLMGVKYLLDDFRKRDTLTSDDQKLLELGLEECDRMKTLIGDLQRLNKPSSGKKSRTDIHPLIEHVLLFQKKHFSSNRIKLQTTFDIDLPQIEIIVDQITQVLFNLTMNAVDAMAKEGGVLTIITRRDGNDMVIEIGDTGSGIAPQHQEQIFEPFFSTKKEEDGTGLGLSISYGIARHHGGNLSFVSEPDRGTIFTLTLPLDVENIEASIEEKTRN